MEPAYLIVASEEDPVAGAVRALWGTPPATGWTVDGSAVRRLTDRALLLVRPGRHVHDERLDARLPAALRRADLPLVFPSIHRSGAGTATFTVHPLGNPTDRADVGGRPGAFTPAAPRWMADALRRLSEAERAGGLGATYEATHHGPYLEQPAFFVEIGFGDAPGPPAAAVRELARVLLELREDPADRVVVGAGGGHYVPHFTELATERSWAFGHLLSRHALAEATPAMLDAAIAATPGAEGVLFARASDALDPRWARLGARRRETEAPRRISRGGGASPPSGT